MIKHNEYFEYLKERSWKGFIYRKFWLYPILSQYLSGKTLDIGCGLGDFLSFRKNTTGVDINPKTIEWCKHRGLDAWIMKKNELPFFDGTFDSAILDNVIEHIDNPGPLLAECNRVLHIKASLIVGVPGICGYKKDSDHKVFYSKIDLITEVSKYGFTMIKVFSMPFSLQWLDSRMTQYCIYGVFKRN